MKRRVKKKCRFFFREGGCHKGRNCPFSHEEEEHTRRIIPDNSQIPVNNQLPRGGFNDESYVPVSNYYYQTPPYLHDLYPQPPQPTLNYVNQQQQQQPIQYYQQQSYYPPRTNQSFFAKKRMDEEEKIPVIIKKCQFFFSNQGCERGNDCTLSHEKFLSPCQFYEATGSCVKSEYCEYLHQYQYRELGRVLSEFKRPSTSTTKIMNNEDRSLDECPADTICLISNYFSKPKNILSLIFCCRSFLTLFSNQNYSVCENVWFKAPVSILPHLEAPFVRRLLVCFSPQLPSVFHPSVGRPYYPYSGPPTYSGPLSPPTPKSPPKFRRELNINEYIKYFPLVEEIKMKYHRHVLSDMIFDSLKDLKRLNRICFSIGKNYSFSTFGGSAGIMNNMYGPKSQERNEVRIVNEMPRVKIFNSLIQLENLCVLDFSFFNSMDSFQRHGMYPRYSPYQRKNPTYSFLIDRKLIYALKKLKNLRELNFNNSSLEVSSSWDDFKIFSSCKKLSPSKYRRGRSQYRMSRRNDNYILKNPKETEIEKRHLDELKSIRIIRVHNCSSITLTVDFLLSFPNANRFQICGCGKLYSREELEKFFLRQECRSCNSRLSDVFNTPLQLIHTPGTPLDKRIKNKKKFHILPKKELLMIPEICRTLCRCFRKCEECRDFFGDCSSCVCKKNSLCFSCFEERETGKKKSDENSVDKRVGTEDDVEIPTHYTLGYQEIKKKKVKICKGCDKYLCYECIETSYLCPSFACGGDGSEERQYCFKCLAKSAVSCSLCSERKCMSQNIKVSSINPQTPNYPFQRSPYHHHHPPPYPYSPSQVGMGSTIQVLQKKDIGGCSKTCPQCEMNGWCFECFVRITSPIVREDTEISKWVELPDFGRNARKCYFLCKCGSGYSIFHQSKSGRNPMIPAMPLITVISRVSENEIRNVFRKR